MAEPLAVPKEPDKQHSLDLTSPPLPDGTADSDSYEEWDEDEYDTEEEEEEEEEDEGDEKKEDEEGKPEVEKKDEKEERLDKKEVDRKEEGKEEKEEEDMEKDMSNTTLEISVDVDTSNVHGAEEKESSDKFQEFHLKPLTPSRNTVEEVQISTMPQEKTRKKFQPKEKPILDEDEWFEPSNEVDFQSIGNVWPEELTPVPEIGSERWIALMEQIRYKNPYEGYVPEETKEPMEAIWDRFNRLDYQEGRYVDEEMYMNEDGTLDMDNMTVEDMEDLTKKFHSESNNKEFKFDYSESVDSMGSRL
ncbi:cilia- and flagella-associated protein 251-like [Macrosteles quadrilineatus]|uniref:cilia- and flagella-associated protein 251-like n=1 Tax=Macrosteles quadrilineatus TaxID=74068 RepID=UPI0023E0C588|nr:cilia- and flagella-associated protein 251-like [Macrosteles quadrilineatus]